MRTGPHSSPRIPLPLLSEPFQYDAYHGAKQLRVYRITKKPYSEASQALDGDWALIQAGMNR